MEKYVRFRFILNLLLILASFACVTGTISPAQTQPENFSPPSAVRLGPPIADDLKVILQRLEIEYLGKDGHRVIGSGCPGNDGRGSVDNYHFVISGVDTYRAVTRVVVLGDNSTLTWAWPCSDTWGLVAEDYGDGVWDVYIAPASPTDIYTVLFFYDDNTMAVGMTVDR